MEWKKIARDQWICEVPPDARFTLKAFMKGDLRWSWEAFMKGTEAARASGIVNSLNAAKNASEQYLKKSGYT